MMKDINKLGEGHTLNTGRQILVSDTRDKDVLKMLTKHLKE